MAAFTGRRLVRSLLEPTARGVAAAGKVLCFDTNTNLTGGTFTTPTIAGATLSGTIAGGTFTGTTLTNPTINGAVSKSTITPAGATIALTSANAGIVLLNTAAGSVATLPAATGSGIKYLFVVTTAITSNAHKILAASSADFVCGIAVGHVAAGTTLTFSAVSTTMHSIQMPFTGTIPSGGNIGDWFEVTDVATNLWAVEGMYLSGTTSTTPFSTATS